MVTVGIARDGEVLATESVADRMAHAEQLTPLIAACVESAGVRLADLEQIVVGLGPGPFTGLRVGIVSAQVLAAVPRLRPARRLQPGRAGGPVRAASRRDFVVATDARRREVYWARYGPDGGPDRRAPGVDAPDALPDLPVVGPAADLYADRLRAVPGPRVLDPGVLALAGPGLPDAGHEPLYLRRPDATESVRRKSVLHYAGGTAMTAVDPQSRDQHPRRASR